MEGAGAGFRVHVSVAIVPVHNVDLNEKLFICVQTPALSVFVEPVQSLFE